MPNKKTSPSTLTNRDCGKKVLPWFLKHKEIHWTWDDVRVVLSTFDDSDRERFWRRFSRYCPNGQALSGQNEENARNAMRCIALILDT
ncbi:MAG TPA: hypothetical protein PK765_01540 [bacterium]|nr:hypothetical protein [bacterium]